MPVFKVSLRQAIELGGVPLYKWSNSFNVLADAVGEAASVILNGWQEELRGAARQSVYAYEVYATDLVPATSSFVTLLVPPGSQRGTMTAFSGDGSSSAGSLYWRDVVLNVELPVAASRPDRKYWRPGLVEGDFDASGALANPTLVSTVQARFVAFLGLSGQVVDGDGSTLLDAQVSKAGVRRLGRQARFDVPTPPPLG